MSSRGNSKSLHCLHLCTFQDFFGFGVDVGVCRVYDVGMKTFDDVQVQRLVEGSVRLASGARKFFGKSQAGFIPAEVASVKVMSDHYRKVVEVEQLADKSVRLVLVDKRGKVSEVIVGSVARAEWTVIVEGVC